MARAKLVVAWSQPTRWRHHTELHVCAWCKELFKTGVGTGRRLDAKFCCDEHKTTFHSLGRTKRKR